MKNDLVKDLDRRRKKERLSWNQVAERLCCTARTLRNWRQGKTVPPMGSLLERRAFLFIAGVKVRE